LGCLRGVNPPIRFRNIRPDALLAEIGFPVHKHSELNSVAVPVNYPTVKITFG